MMQTKYIVIKHGDKEMIFTFPNEVTHSFMFGAVKTIKQGFPLNWTRPYLDAEIVSAGFVTHTGECHGKSESLGVASRPELDTMLLQIGHRP